MFRPILRLPSATSRSLSLFPRCSPSSLVVPSARLGSSLHPGFPSGVPIEPTHSSPTSPASFTGVRFAHEAAETYDQFNDRWKLFFDQAPDLFEVQVSSSRSVREEGQEAGRDGEGGRKVVSSFVARWRLDLTERVPGSSLEISECPERSSIYQDERIAQAQRNGRAHHTSASLLFLLLLLFADSRSLSLSHRREE